jgi:hypothetical protein
MIPQLTTVWNLLGVSVAHAVVVVPGNVPNGPTTDARSALERVLDTLIFFAYPIGFIGIIYIAYKLITSNGDSAAWAQGKKNMINMVIGFFLIVGASILVYSLRGLLFVGR